MSSTAPVLQFIRNTYDDEVIYEVNRDAFDKVGASAQFQRQYGSLFEQEDYLFIIVGTDSGLLAQWIMKKTLPIGTRIIFVEPEAIYENVSPRLPELSDNDHIRLVTGEDWYDLKESFQFQDYAYLDHIKVVQSFASLDAYFTEYRGIHWEVQNKIKDYTWQIEFQLGSQAFVKRQVENIADNKDQAICLKESFDGKTAVLLGGGPSLDELIPWVKENRHNVTVVAVSRICRRLLQAELQPDIVVSIDPHPVSFDVSKEMLEFDEKTLLIHSFHVTPLLLAQWHGPAVYFGERLPWKSKTNGENLPNQGPTVTNTALAMSIHLGFKRIILGGVDLCYDRAGNTHASGSNESNAGPLLGNVGVQVETNGGWMADTRHSFSTAVDIMGTQAERALENNCTIINPAEGAAKIPNVEHILLANIQVAQEKQTAFETISSIIPSNTAEHRSKHYKAMLKEVAHANGRLRAISKLADDALVCNDGLFGRNGKTADFKYKKRMDKIERKLDREYKDISPLVKSFGSRRFLHLVKPDKGREWTDKEIEDWGRAYYEAYQQSAEQLLHMLEDSQQRLRSRLDEEQPQPNFAELFKQWNDDLSPGRAFVWKTHHSAQYDSLTDDDKAQFGTLFDDFNDIIENQETEQALWCQNNYTLAPVRSKLQILFQQQELQELVHTSEELSKNESEEGKGLYALSKGYLAELQNDNDAAFAAYNELVDVAASKMEENEGLLPKSPELEDALRRMSGIALGLHDVDNALLILDTLSALSPTYEPQYAELLRLSGNIESAMDVYAAYLRKAPKDFVTMLKLGKLYQEVGVEDSARWAYNYVIEQDPDNEAAKALLNQLSEPA